MNILIYSLLAIGLIDILSFFSLGAINLVNVGMLHLIPILYVAIKSTHKKTLFVSFLSVVSFNFFFIPPKYTFVVYDTRYWFSFIMMIAVGQLVAWLSQKAAKAKEIETSERLQQTIIESLSHELKTPLSAIKGASSLLVSQDIKLSPEDTYEIYQTIDNGADRMRKLIENLLDTARVRSGLLKLKVSDCDVAEILSSALYKNESTEAIELSIDQQEDTIISGDAVLIELALLNLLDNAFKYGDKISIELFNDVHFVYVKICNSGLIPRAYELSSGVRPFERFSNAKGKDGLGLGLYVAHSIAKMHGGRISTNCDDQRYCATIQFSKRIEK